MEPYDDSMPEILKKNGIYSHLISDHYHYWEDGGCTYHNRYSSWENVRGQEGITWKACVGEKELPPHLGECIKQDMVNREYADTVEKMAQTQTFQAGMEFLDRNHESDNWFLQVETFDLTSPSMYRMRISWALSRNMTAHFSTGRAIIRNGGGEAVCPACTQ